MTTLARILPILLITACFYVQSSYAQDNMGIGTTNPNPNALLDLSASDKGLLVPQMDTTQRNNIPTGNAENGLLIYGSKLNKFFYWNATKAEWVGIPASGSDNQDIQGSGLSASNQLTIGIENGTNETVNLSQLDQPNTDNQALFQNIQNGSGNTQFSAGSASDNLQFQGTGGATVSFNAASNRITIDASGAGSEQDLGYNNQNAPTSNFATHEVTITGGTNATINDYYQPNTDEQNLTPNTAFNQSNNELTIGIQNGTDQTVDLSSLDNQGTDDQNIQGSALSGTQLTIGIENGANETVDLSQLDQPNTDNQDLGSNKSGTQRTITITNGSNTQIDVADNDNDPNNELQDLTISGNNLSIDNGNTVTLPTSTNFWDRDVGNGYLFPLTLNDNIGIGTTAPNRAKLDVEAQSNQKGVHVEGDFNGISGSNIVRAMLVRNTGHSTGQGKYRAIQGASLGKDLNDGRTAGVYGKAGGRDLNIGVFGKLQDGTGAGVYGTTSGANTNLASNTYAGFFNGDLAHTGSLSSPSDRRFKKNIKVYENALAKLDSFDSYTYQFKDHRQIEFADGKQYGFIAQEIENVFPSIVTEASTDDKHGSLKTLNQLQFIPVLTQAIKEQQEIIEQQDRENQNLKQQLQSQQDQINELKQAVRSLQNKVDKSATKAKQ